MKKLSIPWMICAAAFIASGGRAEATPPSHSTGSSLTSNVNNTNTSNYSLWSNYPQNPAFFPLLLWYQSPLNQISTASYTSNVDTQRSLYAGYNVAQAASAVSSTGLIGLAGVDGGKWPEYGGGTSNPRDAGEAAAIRSAGLYLVGGLNLSATNSRDNSITSRGSIAAIQSVMSAAGATQYLLGYNAGDEPNMCDASQIPEISALEGFDPTRPVLLNTTRWFFGWNCNLAQATSLWTSISINSFDEYTTVDQNLALVPQIQTLFTKSDFRSASNDLLFLRGLLVQSARAIQKPGAPLWVFGEAGGDAWVSPYNTMVDQTGNGAAVLSVGSTKIVNNTGFSKFTDSWVGMGLQGQGIPPGTTLAAVGATVAFGVDGCTHATCTEATMSAAATTSNSAATVSVVGGNLARGDGVGAPGRDCVDRLNLCLVSGQEYRTWPSEVNALAWMSIINGATGIEWFCHDFWSASFCLSDISSYNVQAFGLGPDKARSEQAAANAAASNLAYVNKSILQFAPIINSPTIGYCSMDSVIDPANYLIATSSGCTGGVLTMSEHAGYAVPGNALVKTYAGAVYLIAQSTRRGPGAYDFNLLGQAGKVATVVYDSNTRYDPAYSALGKTFPLTGGGSFTDTLGLGRNPTWGDPTDGYQTKIYRIQ